MKNLNGLTRKLSERSRRRTNVFQWRLVCGHIDPLGPWVGEQNNYLASEPVGIPIELQLTLELVDDPADNSSAEALGDWAAMELMSLTTVPPHNPRSKK